MNFEITKFPIIIFSNYRTGSTALGHYLSKKTGLEYVNEPIYRKIDFDALMSYRNSGNKNYILNFMADHAEQDNFYKTILEEDSFKIKLKRQNKIDQISSYYIAAMTNTWITEKSNIINDYSVQLDKDVLRQSFRRILHNDMLIDSCKVNFDLSLTYEELGFLEGIHLKLTVPPKNINAVKNLVKVLLKSKFIEELNI